LLLLTVDVDVSESVEHRLHELVGERAQVVVIQLDPLQAVQILEGRRGDLVDPGGGKRRA